MKVLFSVNLPFFLAHGGVQTLTEALMRELANLGVEVEPERWWDENQKGDILHYMHRPLMVHVQSAHQKGFKVVMTENQGQTASRSRPRLFAQRCLTNLARTLLPSAMTYRLGWDVYRELDAMVYVVPHEWQTTQYLFRATPGRGYIVPHGLEPRALSALSLPQAEEDYLVCMATIYSVKNQLLLAQAARLAGTPIVFLGRPYSEDDPYFREFKQLVDGRVVRHPGHVTGDAKERWLRGARGFVLLSQFESGCIAVHEAAAAGLPLLLPDLPWASKVYHEARNTQFVKVNSAEKVAPALRSFYAQAHRQPGTTFPLLSWREVAGRYLDIYRKLLDRP